MADPYRFGGPIPESVQRLKSRRAYRGSESFANLKRLRGDRFDKSSAGYFQEAESRALRIAAEAAARSKAIAEIDRVGST